MPSFLLLFATPSVALGQANPCFGIVDYADELVPQSFTLASSTDVGNGLQAVEIDVVLDRTVDADFLSAEVSVGLQAASLGAQLEEQTAATFGIFGAGANASTAPLRLTLPAGNVQALLDGLDNGSVPVRVHADENPVVADGVYFKTWDAVDNEMLTPVPLDVGLFPRPWDPNEVVELSIPFVEPLTPNGYPDSLEPGEVLYITPDPEVEIPGIPRFYHYLRIEDVEFEPDAQPGVSLQHLKGHITEGEDLGDVYQSASFCGTAAIDPAVGGTRIPSIDSSPVEDLVRDANTMPLRFNELSLFDGRATLTGQIQGHVLKPTFQLKVRPSAPSRLTIGLDTDVSVTASLRVEAAIRPEDARAEVSLYDLCFPLPDLTFGPVSLPLMLQLEQGVFAEGSLQANTVIDVAHRVRAGFGYDCVVSGGTTTCTAREPVSEERPLAFTPPQIAAGLSGYGEVGTTFGTDLIVGYVAYPQCDVPLLGSRVGAQGAVSARLDLDASADPWWSLGHRTEIEGQVELSALGFEIAGATFPLAGFDTDGASTAQDPLPDLATAGPYLSGQDQRWMVTLDRVDDPYSSVGISDVARLSDGSVILAASQFLDARIAKLDRTGRMVWNLSYLGEAAEHVVALPDDGFAIAGGRSFVARHAADGSVRWARTYDFSDGVEPAQGIDIQSLTAIPVGPGEADLLIVGTLIRAVVDDDAFAVRLDSDGNVVWARYYAADAIRRFLGATVASNGDLVVVGRGDAGPADGVRHNGWMARLDAATGDVIWSRSVLTLTRTGMLWDVVEGPGGALFAVGVAGASDIRLSGAAMVVRMDPDGGDAVHAMLLHDLATEAEQDWEVAPPVESSGSPGDVLYGVDRLGDSIVVVGKSGYSNDTSWAAKLGPDLATEWFLVADGPGRDAFFDVEVAPDGLFIAGVTSAYNAPDATSSERQILVMKAPLSGAVALHPDASSLTLRHSVPGVRATSETPGVLYEDQILHDTPVTVGNLVLDSPPVDRTAGLVRAADDECAFLRTPTGRPTLTDRCADPDLRIPVVRILSPVGPRSVADSAVLDVVFADDGALDSSVVEIDGIPVTEGATLFFENVGLGSHTIVATATDTVGNTAEDRATFTVVDDVPPVLAIVSPADRPYFQGVPIPVEIDVEDEHGDVGEVSLTLDGAPFTRDGPLVGLAPGSHVIAVTARDTAGNVADAEVQFSVTPTRPNGDDDDDGDRGCSSSGHLASGWLAVLALLVVRRRTRVR